ncbi:hypothetical protein FACS189413_03220 [Bacteroidia bacterium]|nr:hypothetical protein FACS189413_03220 [Bacteroidia bacterium]
MNILLLDAQNIQAISVARSLKQCSYFVSAFIEYKVSPGYVSRYIDKKYICPALKSDEKVYIDFLFNFLQNSKQDVIIPLGNGSAELLSKFKEKIELDFSTKCACPTYDTLIHAHNKELLMDLCEKENIPHPRTIGLSVENLEYAANYVGFPAMIKPNISVGARGITLVENLNELQEQFPLIKKIYGNCTLQKFVTHSGSYYNVMIYRDRIGKIQRHTIIKIRRYFPLQGGTSCYCETIDNTQLLEICTKTLEKLNWKGFADFDIMEDIENNDYKIIEINPRTPSSIHAAFVSGINFPAIMVADEMNLEIPHYQYSIGKSIRYMGLDIMWFIFAKNRFTFKPSWFQFFGKNVFYQDGSIKDTLPMFIGFLEGIKKYANPEFRKSKLGIKI